MSNHNGTTPTISPQRICYMNPDLPACAGVESFYMYRIDLVPNAVFTAFFSLSLLGFIVTYAATRRGLGFFIAMALGLLCEIIGYVARILAYKNQWSENAFLAQICTLTIGPAFLAAGIYLCLRRIVYVFGPENSRIRPEMYTRIFIPCDVVSLVLQALGGGMASVASHNGESSQKGDNIMIAGLAFQVFTLLLFMGASADFALRALRRHRQLGAAAFDQDARLRAVRGSWLFKGFVLALVVSTICIFWRSVFRVAELSGGWSGYLMTRQDLFVGFEGVMIVVACLVLNVFHPAVCFKEMMEGQGGIGSGRKRKGGKVAYDAAGGKSEAGSDAEGAKTGGVRVSAV